MNRSLEVGARTAGASHIHLELVSKYFGGATALSEVSLDILQGEVHCLVGENGAGKSTLGKVIAGVYRPDGGTMSLRGVPTWFRSPRDSIAAGVAFIAQELAIVPDRSVLENVYLGQHGGIAGWVSNRRLRAAYDELSDRVGFRIDPDARAGSIRLADQQKVEIMRSIACDADLIIMDEPTAALAGSEADQLLSIITDLRSQGKTVVFVTHFLGDALQVADRVTVLKDGRLVQTTSAAGETPDSLVEAMLGRSLGSMFPEPRSSRSDEVVLDVRGLTREPDFADVSLRVRRGEIVGIAGLVGSGRTELVETITGLERATSGTVRVGELAGPFRSPYAAQQAGLVMVPESRKEHGLILSHSVRENIALPHLRPLSRLGFINRNTHRKELGSLLSSLHVDSGRLSSPVGDLSGGNQQKVLFAKWLLRRPDVLIADEPTRGVDVGARAAIYDLLRSLADEGAAVLFVSSDNEEVIGLADRVLVMRAGRLVGELDGDEATEDRVLTLMFQDETREDIA